MALTVFSIVCRAEAERPNRGMNNPLRADLRRDPAPVGSLNKIKASNRTAQTAIVDGRLNISHVNHVANASGSAGSNSLEELKFLQHPARAFAHGAERIVSGVDRESGFLSYQAVNAAQ